MTAKLLWLVRRLLRKIFCIHQFNGISEDSYDVIRDDDGTKEGDVKILHLRCGYCGREKIIAVDRTHLEPKVR